MADQSAEFQQVELFGIPALYSIGRVKDREVPDGLYRYDLRGSDYGPGTPATIEKNVITNYAGSILMPLRIPYIYHGEALAIGSGLNFADSKVKSVTEFQQLWGPLENYSDAVEIMHNNIILENEKLAWAGHRGPLMTHENVFTIYQIRGSEVPYEFMNMDFVSKHGMPVKAVDYTLVYGGLLEPGTGLNILYNRFNEDLPDGFYGHSMSVSDVVILNRGEVVQAWYVDGVGFAPMQNFVRERAELVEAKELIDDFMCREYEGNADADYRHPARVDIAYSTTEDGKYDVQACVNLEACRMEKYLNGKEVSRDSCRDLRDLIDTRLKDLDFSSLTAVSEQEKDRYELGQDHACKKAVEEAIDNGYDHETSRLSRTSCCAVVDQFGPDRVERVLAVTVRLKDADGRFSPETKAWAKSNTELLTDEEIRETARKSECEIISHPALLDGFIGFTRQYIDVVRGAENVKTGNEIELLAADLDQLARAYDPYEYHDTVGSSEENINRIRDQIQSGDTDGIRTWLNRVRSDPRDEDNIGAAESLLKRLDGIAPERGTNNRMKDSEPSL